MTTGKRFSGLMGTADESLTTTPTATRETKANASARIAKPEAATRPSMPKVQLNTQQPEELKAAVSKAASYLSYTSGEKVTTTEVVERALREFLLSGAFPSEVTEPLVGHDHEDR